MATEDRHGTGEPLDPKTAFDELGRIRLSDLDLDGVLERVAELAKRSIPGASEVSVTLVQADRPRTAAFTGRLAMDLDERQYEQGHGPCLDAAAAGVRMTIKDMRSEARWPDWTPRALARGAMSSLSVGLPLQDVVSGALNIYGTRAGAFEDEDTVEVASTFAGYASVALANAHLYESTALLAHQMQQAMDSRAVIEQAKGIIMAERRCSSDEAFAVLSKISQNSNRKLRDVAAALVERTERSGDA